MSDAPTPTAVELVCLDCDPVDNLGTNGVVLIDPKAVGELDVHQLAQVLADALNPLILKVDTIAAQVAWLGEFATQTTKTLTEAQAMAAQGAELMSQAEQALSGGGIGALMRLLGGR